MNDIAFIIFTNEKYFDLLDLTLPFTIDNTKHLFKNIYIVSNKIPNITNKLFNNVILIDTNVQFATDGSHFSQVMREALPQIKERYILFLCDDYLIKSPIKKQIFNDIIALLNDLNGDYMALGTQKHMEYFLNNWTKPEIDYSKYHFPHTDIFYAFDPRARHMYSVQPCIWKKDSLLELFDYNKNLSLHQLDNTDVMNKKGEKRHLDPIYNFMLYADKNDFFDYNFKNYCYHYPPLTYHVDEKAIGDDFFVIDYIEIVRNGKFISFDVNSKFILNQVLDTNPDIRQKLTHFLI